MKTIIILHHVSSMGGGTNSMFDIAVMLKKTYNVVLCVPLGSKEIINKARELNLGVHEIVTPIPSLNVYSGMPGYFNRYFWSSIFRFRNSRKLINEIMRLKPNAVIFNTSVTALIAKKLPKNVKRICFVRETFVRSPFNSLIKINLENNFDGVAYIAKHEMNFINIRKPKQIIIPDCFVKQNTTKYDKAIIRQHYSIPSGKFCLLFMGGLNRIKGLDVLLKAAECLDDRFLVVIAGEINNNLLSYKNLLRHFYDYKNVRFFLAVKKRLNTLYHSGKILNLGYVDDISPLMSMCDTVVFPSTSAHQPRPCIEAGYFNRSCIISDYDATKEYFINKYNTLTFKPKNYKMLANKIEYLYCYPRINDFLAKNNKKMTLKKHDYSLVQKRINSFLCDIMEK